ncbi:MAG: thiamine phosphate synthase [Nitrospiria bacterium]
MSVVDFKLYMIGDRHQCGPRSLLQVIHQAGEAGVSAVQFREKDLSLKAQFDLASEVKKVTVALGMKLLINDRVDLCLALDADGVHLPVDGLPVEVVRNLLGDQKLIGCSCHSLEEVQQAESTGADFCVLGPVFETPSKRVFGKPLGLIEFETIKTRTNIPLFALGGIGIGQIKKVFLAGADGVSMVSSITSAGDVTRECHRILSEIEQFSEKDF